MAIQTHVDNGTVSVFDTDTGNGTFIPLEAIASWRALLKYDSDAEALQAILNSTDPGIIDETTGENAFTPAYEQLEQDMAAAQENKNTGGSGFPSYVNGIDGSTLSRYRLGLVQPMRLSMVMMAMPATGNEQDSETSDPTSLDSLSELLAPYSDKLSEQRNRFVESIAPPQQKGTNQ